MALRVGTEDKKKVYLATGLAVLMVILLVRFLWQNFGPSTPVQPPSTAVTTPAVPAAGSAPEPAAQPYPHEAAEVASSSSLDPTLHPEIMRQAESLAYTGSGRNIFSQFSAPPIIPKAIASARPATGPAAPTGPPQPPPIDLRFYGYAAENDGHKQVFLLKGDDIFIASEGDVVDRRYRVGKINAASVLVEDLPYHDTQTLPLMQ